MRTMMTPDEAPSCSLPKEIHDIIPKSVNLEALKGTGCQAAAHFPITPEQTEQIEEILAKEMDKLSLVERDQILFDIHGFSEPEEEVESTINDLLKQMEVEILKSKLKKAAYLEAKYLNEEYVTDRAFRLMFIRSEKYDPKLAAVRLITHFAIKQDLFGSGEILGREIRLSDLSQDDMTSLESGFMQVLPTRDAAGRSIFCVAPSHKKYKTPENLARSAWYVFTTTLRDEETQKKGVVMVVYNTGKVPKAEEMKIMGRIHRTRQGIPKRIVGGHYCYSDASLRPFVAGMRLFLDKEVRNRLRAHYGTHDDLLFKLQTFGINTKDHPMADNGILSLAWHQEWLQIRKTQEECNRAASDDITVPRRFDVLFGRGKNTREHTGNLRAAHLVDMYQHKYEHANKFQKTEIAERIVSIIHESYGRFLKWENDLWVEVEHDAAREKISHFFRHNRSKKPPTTLPPTAPPTTVSSTSTDNKLDPAETISTSIKRVTPCPSPVHTGEVGDEREAKHIRDHR
mmetsp:Transcript_77760/g.116955  ORF Transcript_77760/g.116955 Transcript_77760/m.116955 type:complete len:513 (+) Transcript_77760:269-1807(+)